MMENVIVCGDNLKVLPEIPDESIDLIATDPPYSWGFMNLSWDKVLPPVEAWRECFRVLKPGAFAFIMSGTRQDCLARMIVNLEDAGFDVGYTSIYWSHATGFPKAANISKMADARLGVEREVVTKRYKGKHGGGNSYQWSEMDNETGEAHITAPATPEAQALDGAFAGYQPKPCLEVVLCVQRPFTDKHSRSDVYKMLGGKYDYWYTQRTEVKAPKDGQKGNMEQLSKKWAAELAAADYALKDGDVIERRLALTPENNDEVIVKQGTGTLAESVYR